MKFQTGILTALAAGAGYVALGRLRRIRPIGLGGKIVFITGGSRGLGLAMAREFGAYGATVAFCARNRAELERAKADLYARGINSHTFVCDITSDSQVNLMIDAVTDTLGPIDILVNNAGNIRVGPFSDMTLKDFDEAMQVMFWGTLHTTLAVLPSMRSRKQGSIVNITSIGGKVSVPHLLPYSCAKFATVALSEGLRAELAPAGIRVTTIAPGLMRTGSHLHAEFKGKQANEYAWFAAGAATPVVSIEAKRAARSIVRATVRGESEKILSIPADLLARIHGLFPGVTSGLFTVANFMLPGDGGSRHALPGHEIEAKFKSRIWRALTKVGRTAAESLNEIPGGQASARSSL